MTICRGACIQLVEYAENTKRSKKSQALNEALCKSIANRDLVARSRRACPERSRGNPGDACLQMLLGAFLPQTTTQDKKVRNSDRSGVEGPAIFSPISIPSSITFSLRHSTRTPACQVWTRSIQDERGNKQAG